MDIDTRLLRSFTAVAEEGNLTRAAQRLFVAQPTLTKQIRQLETLLGVPLFTRSRAGMRLTAAGRALADEAAGVLARWDRAVRETRGAAGREARVLRVGFVASAANESTQAIVAEFARRRPDWRVLLRHTDWTDPSAGLADGAVDAALVRVPFPGDDAFRVEELLTEPRWVALWDAHPLAALDEIPFDRLRDEPFVAAPPETGTWRDFWVGDDADDGRTALIGAVARNTDEWLAAIAGGHGISLTPAASARFYPRPGVTYRPVTGLTPTRVGVAWPPSSTTGPALQDFVRSCLTTFER
ncbi:LysR family transcriptional regulator [Streptomyces pristinaespiralis]|uniref:LysR family transcriptional regulator n=1 Tax=Streptomyces pristinaespiralis TaxID=38300 RepID=UPI003833AC27